MSVVKDTTNLRPYKTRNLPVLPDGMPLYLANELKTISASLNAVIVALKSIEARIVVGGL